MRTSRHIEVVKSKPKGEAQSRPRLDYVIQEQLVVGKKKRKKKKKRLKKCRAGQLLSSAAGLEPSDRYFASNDVAAGASGVGTWPSAAAPARLRRSLRSRR